MRPRRFELIYAPLVKDHLRAIHPRFHPVIRENIEEQLQFRPDLETRNRKPLRRPAFDATWEIRFGPDNRFRVLYKINAGERKVYILAVGEKEGERLWVGGQEIRL